MHRRELVIEKEHRMLWNNRAMYDEEPFDRESEVEDAIVEEMIR